ncbi:unnamed protein product [Pedinophyceae sp. YPF-701]|nr:unnamed protein product [Pedinophyceae sp. YPF-701]
MSKRKSPGQDAASSPDLPLERVVGLTALCPRSLACSPVSTSLIAYTAGCVAVLYDARKDQQLHLLRAPGSPRALSALSFSPDGATLAVGELGAHSTVLLYDISTGALARVLKGAHTQSIRDVQFSSDGSTLASVGTRQDGILAVWHAQSGALLAKHELTDPARAVAFSEDGTHITLAGPRSVQVYPAPPAPTPGAPPALHTATPRPARLGNLRSSRVAAVAPARAANGPGSFLVTSEGALIAMKPSGLLVSKWLSLKVRAAFSVDATARHVACGCSDGVVRVFSAATLQHVANMPRPHAVGHEPGGATKSTLLAGADPAEEGLGTEPTYPDAVALSFGGGGGQLSVVYSDRSVYVYKTSELPKVTKLRVIAGHAACIWGLSAAGLGMSSGLTSAFTTCSADGTVRFWSLTGQREEGPAALHCKTVTISAAAAVACCRPVPVVAGEARPAPGAASGLRSVCVHEGLGHMAVGDLTGNVHVIDMAKLERTHVLEAHDDEVLSLGFSGRSDRNLTSNEAGGARGVRLASAGRDGLVHLYDADGAYASVGTLDAHEGPIPSIRFTTDGARMVTCGADGRVAFWLLADEGSRDAEAAVPYAVSVPECGGAAYDVDIELTGQFAYSVGEARSVGVWDLASGECMVCQEVVGATGAALRVATDPSGIMAACAGADRAVRMLDLNTGETLACGTGHGDIVTGALVTQDCRRVVSCGADGLLMVWRVPDELADMARTRLADALSERIETRSAAAATASNGAGVDVSIDLAGLQARGSPGVAAGGRPGARAAAAPDASVDLSMGLGARAADATIVSLEKLPKWARGGAGSGRSTPASSRPGTPKIGGGASTGPSTPRGKWAGRTQQQALGPLGAAGEDGGAPVAPLWGQLIASNAETGSDDGMVTFDEDGGADENFTVVDTVVGRAAVAAGAASPERMSASSQNLEALEDAVEANAAPGVRGSVALESIQAMAGEAGGPGARDGDAGPPSPSPGTPQAVGASPGSPTQAGRRVGGSSGGSPLRQSVSAQYRSANSRGRAKWATPEGSESIRAARERLASGAGGPLRAPGWAARPDVQHMRRRMQELSRGGSVGDSPSSRTDASEAKVARTTEAQSGVRPAQDARTDAAAGDGAAPSHEAPSPSTPLDVLAPDATFTMGSSHDRGSKTRRSAGLSASESNGLHAAPTAAPPATPPKTAAQRQSEGGASDAMVELGDTAPDMPEAASPVTGASLPLVSEPAPSPEKQPAARSSVGMAKIRQGALGGGAEQKKPNIMYTLPSSPAPPPEPRPAPAAPAPRDEARNMMQLLAPAPAPASPSRPGTARTPQSPGKDESPRPTRAPKLKPWSPRKEDLPRSSLSGKQGRESVRLSLSRVRADGAVSVSLTVDSLSELRRSSGQNSAPVSRSGSLAGSLRMSGSGAPKSHGWSPKDEEALNPPARHGSLPSQPAPLAAPAPAAKDANARPSAGAALKSLAARAFNRRAGRSRGSGTWPPRQGPEVPQTAAEVAAHDEAAAAGRKAPWLGATPLSAPLNEPPPTPPARDSGVSEGLDERETSQLESAVSPATGAEIMLGPQTDAAESAPPQPVPSAPPAQALPSPASRTGMLVAASATLRDATEALRGIQWLSSADGAPPPATEDLQRSLAALELEARKIREALASRGAPLRAPAAASLEALDPFASEAGLGLGLEARLDQSIERHSNKLAQVLEERLAKRLEERMAEMLGSLDLHGSGRQGQGGARGQ